MKAYGRVKGKIITFLTLALDEDEWSTSWLVPLSPYPNWLEGQMILVVNLDALVDVSDSCISQESNSGSSVVHPVAQRMCHLDTPGQVLAHRQNVCKISRQFGLSCPVNFVPRTSLPPDSLENIN